MKEADCNVRVTCYGLRVTGMLYIDVIYLIFPRTGNECQFASLPVCQSATHPLQSMTK